MQHAWPDPSISSEKGAQMKQTIQRLGGFLGGMIPPSALLMLGGDYREFTNHVTRRSVYVR